jgi:OOP family OmpA-OmpF porin
MKTTRSIGTAHICLLACLLSPVALAAEPGIYAGFNLGRASSKIDKTRITDELFAPGFTYTSRRSDTKDVGFKLYGGYQFTPYFSLEAGYFDLGSYNLDTAILPAGMLLSDMGIRGINFDAVFTLPVSDKMSVFARAGMNKIQLDSDFYGSGSAANGNYPSGNRRDTHEKFGVGMAYEINDAVSVRVEAERYNLEDVIRRDGNVNLYSVGLVYSFAKAKPAPVAVVAPSPAPVVAPTPTPPPAPVVTTLSADSFFDFDKDVLLPAGQRELDALAASLRGTQYDTIAVTGHTDRLGRAAYNLALSTRRAEAVKAYLVRAGIPANKISARGVNGANPVTTAASCPGTVATPALIACLQPDRRVEVAVTATR